jgi:hypothetical protein
MATVYIHKDAISLEILLAQINTARNRMQQLWDEKGYTDDEVLAASMEVDHLMNEYDQASGFLTQERKNTSPVVGKVSYWARPLE